MTKTLRFLAAWTVLLLLCAFSLTTVNAQPSFTKTFSANPIGPGSSTTLTFLIDNTDSGTPVSDLAFTDVLPAGMTIATPASAATNCGPGGVSAPAGGTTISLTGGTVGAFSACTVTVNITGTASARNTSGDLTSDAGNSGPATDSLTVDTTRPGFYKSFSPNPVTFGSKSTLTFTIDASLIAGGTTTLISFTDVLPSGMVIATPANASTDCDVLGPPLLTATAGTSTISLISGSVAASSICTVTVDVTTASAGAFDNVSLELSSIPPGFGSAVESGFATARLNVVLETLIKTFTDDPVAPGGTVTLEFKITNLNRSDTATDYAFTDTLDNVLPGLSPIGLPIAVCNGGTLDETAPGSGILELSGPSSLAPGEMCTFSVSLSVPGGASTGTFPNTTTPIEYDLGGTPTTGNAATDDLIVAFVPNFSKEFTDDPVSPDSTVTLKFTIENTHPTETATDIAFIDELTTFLPFPVSVTLPPDGFCGPGSSISVVSLGTNREGLSMTGGELAGGAMCMFDVLIDIPADQPGGTYTNTTETITATVDGEPVEGSPATDDLVVVAPPSLSKAFLDDPVPPGGTVTLEFTLTHRPDASGDATSIAFTDTLDIFPSPPGLSPIGLPISACNGGTLDETAPGSGILEFTGGMLMPGEMCTFSVMLSVPASAPIGLHTNTTSAVTAVVDGFPVSGNKATDDLLVSSLTFTKAFTDDPVMPGDPVTLVFTFTLDSSASGPISIIFFSDDLGGASGTLPGLAATGPPTVDTCGGTFAGTTFITYTGGSISPGATCTISVPLLVPLAASPGTYPNTTSDLFTDVGTLPPATDVLTVFEDPPPAFSKNFSPNPIAPGGVSTLTFTIDNTPSTTDATGLDFTDPLPAGVVIATPANASTTCTGGTLTAPDGGGTISYTGGTVTAGASCTVTVDVTSGAEGTYMNVSGDLTSSLGNSGPATDDLVVEIPPELIATKVDTLLDGDGIANPGDTLKYTVELTVVGPRTATAVVFTDTVDVNTFLDCTTNPPTTTQGLVTTCDDATGEVVVAVGDIPGGGSVTIMIWVTIDNPLAAGVDEVCNQGLAEGTNFPDEPTGDPDETGPGDPDDPTCIEVEAAPDMVLAKDDGRAVAFPGETLTYTLSYENDGDQDATGVVLTETVPIGTTSGTNPGWEVGSVGSTFPCDGQSAGIVCVFDAGAVAAGDSLTALFEVLIDNPIGAGIEAIVDTASVADDGTNGPDPTPDDNTAIDSTAVDAMPDVSGTKRDSLLVDNDGDGKADPGDTIRYTVVVSNDGPQDAADVVLTDTPGANTTLVVGSVTTTQGTIVEGNTPGDTFVQVDLTTVGGEPLPLLPQATATVTFDVTIDVPFPANRTFVENQGTVDFTGETGPEQTRTDDPDAPGPFDPTRTPVDRTADVSLEKTVDNATPDFGSNVVFTIVVTNDGPVAPVLIEVKDLLPAGLTYVSHTATEGTYTPATGLWKGVALDYLDTDTLRITARVETVEPTTNTAEVVKSTLPDDDSTPNNHVASEDDQDSATIVPVAADLAVRKDLVAVIDRNDDPSLPDSLADFVFEITVFNGGPSVATGVEVLDPVPTGTVFVSASASQGSYNPATGLWSVGTLGVGDDAVLVLRLRAPRRTDTFNYAQVSGDQPDQDLSNNVSADGVGRPHRQRRFQADLELAKTVDNAAPAPGALIRYTLAVFNRGPERTSGVEVLDRLPEGLEFVSATATPSCPTCGYDDSLGVWIVGPLPVDSTATLEIVVRVTGTGEITNRAEVFESHLPDPDSETGNGDLGRGEDDEAEARVTVTGGGKATSIVREGAGGIPAAYELGRNYPNPFNPETVIPFGLPEAVSVRLEVYDLLGRRVAMLLDEPMAAGRHEVTWQAGDLPTGLYLVRLQAGSIVKTQRVTLVK